jgi:hypothetical protein
VALAVIVVGIAVDRTDPPSSSERARPVAPGRTDAVGARKIVDALGLAVSIPARWRGEIFSTSAEVGGLPSITHLTSFATDMRQFEIGSSPIGAGDVRIVLLEFPSAQIGQQGFQRASLPLQVSATEAVRQGPGAVIRQRAVLSGRPFSLAVEIGRPRPAPTQVRAINDILRTLTVEPRADADPAIWAPLRRPLHLPKIASGAACPTSNVGRSGPAVGITLGKGPAFPALGSSTSTATLRDDLRVQGQYMHKTLWAISPAHRGPILIRGGRLDGPGVLRFGRPHSPALQLPPGSGGWRYFPTSTVVPAAGCYAFQVDGAGFSRLIVFTAA